ncbi:hypothetical protein L9G74_03860 [Shewanella sp. C32]|uniref:Lipoprotein n=1 Tax=Shewanella electrica TaxID=515560 RepID=A0ABT2FGW1_9GAMM|nr:hypothetical protein [Shewanella electrica]MCH1923463.1 hypothetical protein [Shewanella electrica]MCS4555560.1 hypothetical protein [Shewanella electrica]
MKNQLLFSALLLLGGCASTSSTTVYSNTMDIISTAAAAAPEMVTGDYTLFIKAVGQQGNNVYLNTELDYRDQRNVTIVLPIPILPRMGIHNFTDLEHHFLNHGVQIHGNAMRARIDFMRDHRPTDLYYYQTHIVVANPTAISVIDAQ